MPTSARDRLLHVQERITRIRELWRGTDLETAIQDPVKWPAFERHLEIISEASRDIPAAWKAKHGLEIPWPKVAGLGNLLRHVYQRIDGNILWDIYENDLTQLHDAIRAMLADSSLE
jgi:uncharacterized protein with HEPN domain